MYRIAWTSCCLLGASAALTLAMLSCRNDHDLLAATTSTAASTGGSGGASTSSTMGQGGQRSIVEPEGPTKLTLVNGVVDADAVSVCLVPYPEHTSSTNSPWPNDSSGLPFAHALHAAIIDDVVPANSDVELFLLTGELQQASENNCAQLIDSPPAALAVRSLGVLPASVFEEPKSILLVLDGCIGGDTHTGPLETAACGANYTPTQPTVSLVAGFISRITDDEKVSLQFVHAVAGMGQADVYLTPGLGSAASVKLLSSWTLGSIAPFPPYKQLGQVNLGNPDSATLELYPDNETEPPPATSLAAAFEQGTASSTDMANGRNVAFVAIGAAPGASGEAWFHELTWTAVAPDP